MTLTLAGTERFAALFESERARLPGAGARWLNEARASALAVFSAQGLPNQKTEGWRFTPAKKLAETVFEPAERPPRAAGSAAGRCARSRSTASSSTTAAFCPTARARSTRICRGASR